MESKRATYRYMGEGWRGLLQCRNQYEFVSPLSFFCCQQAKREDKGHDSRSYCMDILLRHESWNQNSRTSTSVVDYVFKSTISVLAAFKDSVFVPKMGDGVSETGQKFLLVLVISQLTKSQHCCGWGSLLRSSSQPSCSVRVTSSRLPRTMARQLLNISRDGDPTISGHHVPVFDYSHSNTNKIKT